MTPPTQQPTPALPGSDPWLGPLALALLPPIVLWTALLIVVPPDQQEFPLNDDCLYSRTAFTLVRGGGLDYYNQASMPLLGQVIWAAPFIWLGGESHVALRISIMFLACVCLLSFFDLLRQEKRLGPWQTAVVVLCLGLNPLFFLLSCKFHSDVPALAFSLVSLCLYNRGLNAGKWGWWLGGAALAGVAVLTRQNCVVVPAVAGLLLLCRPGFRWRPLWVLGAAVPLAGGFAVDWWMSLRPDVPHLKPDWDLSLYTLKYLGIAWHYMGLACLPLLVLRNSFSRRLLILALLASAIVGLLLTDCLEWATDDIFPFVGNCLTEYGQFYSGNVYPGERPLQMGLPSRLLLTALGWLGATVLAVRAFSWVRAGYWAQPLPLFTLLHIPLLLISPYFFDRYCLVLFPGALALAAGEVTRGWRTGILGVILVLSGLFSLASVHDFLTWNQALWQLGRRAVAQGIAPTDIEGGFAWNGWHAPRASKDEESGPRQGLVLWFTWDHFPHVTGRYAISFSKLNNVRVLDSENYHLWLIPGEQTMLFLEHVPTKPKAR
jgi:4-amino-4-deoxy-L-arabinose transferase-like glycosyltransferase